MILSTDTLTNFLSRDMAAWLPCVYTSKPCIDRFVVKSFGRKNLKCQAVFDDVPEGEEGEANEEA